MSSTLLRRPVSTLRAIDDDGLELLALRAASGDGGALESVLRASYDLAWPVCRRITGNDTDAADATQEALISVARAIARFDRRSRYSTWLYRIAVNAAIDEIRRRRRHQRDGWGEGRGPGPAADVDSVAVTVDVDRALLRVPLDFRAAVVLRDLCGLDYDEISKVLGIPPGTVRSRIARGRAALVHLLEPAVSPP